MSTNQSPQKTSAIELSLRYTERRNKKIYAIKSEKTMRNIW